MSPKLFRFGRVVPGALQGYVKLILNSQNGPTRPPITVFYTFSGRRDRCCILTVKTFKTMNYELRGPVRGDTGFRDDAEVKCVDAIRT
jgi:hypothetical protein